MEIEEQLANQLTCCKRSDGDVDCLPLQPRIADGHVVGLLIVRRLLLKINLVSSITEKDGSLPPYTSVLARSQSVDASMILHAASTNWDCGEGRGWRLG